MNVGKMEKELSNKNIELEKKNILLEKHEKALLEFTRSLNEQTMAIGKMERELYNKNIELEKKNKQLQENEDALIHFTTDLNEQTMNVGKMEKELKKKSELLEMLNNKLNEANSILKTQNEQLLEELEMAKRVQETLIPDESKFPHQKELGFGSKYLSMEKIGGDLYDVIKVGQNGLSFLIADVSGHGVPAALITTMAKVSFNSYSQKGLTTAEVCRNVNKDFVELIGDLIYYITAYYAFLDLETGIFQYTNAGHHPAIYYRKRTNRIRELNTEGTVIGAFAFEVEYTYGTVKLEDGDRILLFTDGITETKSCSGEVYYGKERLKKFVRKNSNLPPKEFVNALVKEIETFSGGRPPEDDRAILYFEYNSKATPEKFIENVFIEASKTDRIKDEL